MIRVLMGAAVVWAAAFAASDTTTVPQRLADTGLYDAGVSGAIDPRNRSFSPQYPLWTDGMSKRRWIYLPPGGSIDGRDEDAWVLPVGTKLWKEFSFNGRRVETRMLWKVADDRWELATYAWNEDGTDATLAPADGIPGVVEVAPGRRHTIPSRADCAACHGTKRSGPLGFNALQLSPDRDPNAINGEPLKEGMLTLKELVDERLLTGGRADLVTNAPRIRTAAPETRAVLGYLSTNCGVCHNGNGEIAAMGPTIRTRDLLTDGDAVARSLAGHRTKWQLPGAEDGTTVLVTPGAPDLSAIIARMRSRSPSSQMPPLGTVVRDQQAVDAVTRWVAAALVRAH